MTKTVTIKDVAQRAHVSVATVSRVLSGKTASEQSKTIVKKAVQELNYTPNAVARSLRVQRRGVVGVLVSDLRNPYFGGLAHDIQVHLAERDYAMIVGNASESHAQQEEFLAQAMEHRVDGMIVVFQGRKSPQLEKIVDHGIPVVFVDRYAKDYEIPVVDSDSTLGIRAALEHLKALGHTNIGMMIGPEDTSTTRQRREVFLHEGAALGIKTFVSPEHGITPGDDPESLVRALLDRGVTAIIFAYTPCMWEALSYLSRIGVQIPKDLSVIGFDDLSIMEYLNPPLTTIAQDVKQMSAVAVQTLHDLIQGKGGRSVHLPTRLIVRDSTGKATAKPIAQEKRKDVAL